MDARSKQLSLRNLIQFKNLCKGISKHAIESFIDPEDPRQFVVQKATIFKYIPEYFGYMEIKGQTQFDTYIDKF